MNLYFQMLEKPVFTINDVNKYYNNIESARSAVKRMIKQGLVKKIRNNMYTCISGETKSTVADCYQIASAMTPSAYISHFSAMAYYGFSNQTRYDMFVSSETQFLDFEFEEFMYRYVPSKCALGIENVKYSGGIRITNLERTVIDIIKDLNKLTGIEEVIENLSMLPQLNEERLLRYLGEYDIQFLYQKTGYLLSLFNQQLNLSPTFFDICVSKTGKSKRYLAQDETHRHYDARWRLIVPEDILIMKNGE